MTLRVTDGRNYTRPYSSLIIEQTAYTVKKILDMEDEMTYGKISRHYNRTSIETASNLDLVVMCYEKSIQLLKQAKVHFIEKEIEEKTCKLQKALDIINELQCSLNTEKGGQIAVNLQSIYIYLTQKLISGDINKDISAFDEAVNILSELKEAWDHIKINDQNQPTEKTRPDKAILSQIAA